MDAGAYLAGSQLSRVGSLMRRAGLAAGCGALATVVLWVLIRGKHVWLNVTTGPDSFVVIEGLSFWILLVALLSGVAYVALVIWSASTKAFSKHPSG